MKKYITTLFLALVCSLSINASTEINFGWRFAKGDQKNAIAANFDDSSWEQVDLPHDWAISGPFGALGDNGATGKLPWKGEGWYRKRFKLDAQDKGKRLIFVFDGVMANPTIYLNGKKVGSWTYGYNSFWLDATDAARFGSDNFLVVHADTRQHHSRWYPGAGIYRKVTMLLEDPLHIPVWGVFVTTPQVTDKQGSVNAKVDVNNSSSVNKQVEVNVVVKDASGKSVAETTVPVSVSPGASKKVSLDLVVKTPRRWDIGSPYLYKVETTLTADGAQKDLHSCNLGFRTFKWTADDGFHLNGRRVQLYGVNLHHDQGPLGAAFLPRAMERQLQIMMDMGVNSVRTSHNAAAPEVLELCDRLGLVVFDELFDKYGPTAGVQCSTADYVNKYAEREIKNFILRDRNHPSVCLWSIGNEIDDILANRDGKAAQHVAKMTAFFRKYDTTRPTTMGNHIPAGVRRSLGIFDTLDTSGWNYGAKYVIARMNYPKKPLIYSESGSVFGSRGAYKLKLPEGKTDWGDDGYLTAYCLTSAMWSDIPEQEFERMIMHRYVAGEYVWTGFDYIGEPTPFNGKNKDKDGRLARSSYFGIVDLAGLPKDSFYLYRSHWQKADHTIHLTPHWNWKGKEGKHVPVMLYTDGDEAELFLNGKSLGRRKKKSRKNSRAANLAYRKVAQASSEEHKQDQGGNVIMENLAGKACDGSQGTRWCASSAATPQHLEVDLGALSEVSFVRIHWEKGAWIYEAKLQVSENGDSWSDVKTKRVDIWGMSEFMFKPQKVRKLRVVITKIKQNNVFASIREIGIMQSKGGYRSPYYDPIDIYRLIWKRVPYAQGEIKAVVYRDGKKIGEDTVRTVGKPAGLKLTPDRKTMQADGMDLCYVTIEMVDSRGDVCPLAMDDLTFRVSGAAKLAGVANGDQMGHDSFTDNTHPLFYGKAVAVLRSIPGKTGPVEVVVTTKNGMTARCSVSFK